MGFSGTPTNVADKQLAQACTIGLVVLCSALALAQTTRPSSIQTKAASPQQRNILALYSDDAFAFVGRHFGNGKDPAGPTEPGLFVHEKGTNKWLEIAAISTIDGRFGRSGDMLVSVFWDFTPFAKRPYIDQPLRTPGSVMFPDRIVYDSRTGRYELGHSTRAGVPSSETVLYIRRTDLIEAFARAR